MSSGGAEVPIAALVIMLAVPLAALAVAGGAAVLLARAAAAAGEALATRIVVLGELIESQKEAYVTAQEAADAWQLGVTEVVQRNARIAAMAATARSLGEPAVPIPRSFDVAGKSLCDMYEWCQRADEQIERAQRKLADAVTAAAGRRLAASLPPGDVRLVTAEQLLAERKRRLDASAATVRASAVRASATADRIRAAADLAGVARQVEESLVALDPEARPDDLAAVAEISVLAKTSPLIQARSHVEHLGLVVKEANDRVEEARRAARLLQGVRLDPLPCDLDGQDLAVVASLESVVAGERRLDQALICDAQRVLGKVQTAGARLYLREQVRQIMEANGYQVEGDFTTLRPGIDNLTLTRPDWAEHHLRLVLSDDKLSYVTLRDYQVQGDAAALLDRERCAQSGADISLLVGALRSRGVDVETVATRDDPPVLFLGPPPKVVRTTAIQAGERGQASLTLPDEGGSRR